MKKLITVFLLGCSLGVVSHLFAKPEGYRGVDAIIINGHELRGKVEFRFEGSGAAFSPTVWVDDEGSGTKIVHVVSLPESR